MPLPTDRRPWAGETVALPPRVRGQRIVAAIKLPTNGKHPAHQWAIVLETAGASFSVEHLIWIENEGFRSTSFFHGIGYPEAVAKMTARYFQDSPET